MDTQVHNNTTVTDTFIVNEQSIEVHIVHSKRACNLFQKERIYFKNMKNQIYIQQLISHLLNCKSNKRDDNVVDRIKAQ